MKRFETPEIEVIKFKVEDILTASDNELPLEGLSSDELKITKIG